MDVWSAGAIEAALYVGVVEARKYGGLELWSIGVALQACRRGGMEKGVLEARSRRVDVEGREVRSSGALEARSRRVDVEAWRHGGLEARCWSSDVKVRRYGALQMRCRRVNLEEWIWSGGGLEGRCICSDVEE